MNLQEYDRFHFIVEPVNHIYEKIIIEERKPNIEEIHTHYDDLVRYRTTDFLYHHFHHFSNSPLLQDAIHMRPCISRDELVEVMNSFSIFYEGEDKCLYNTAVKGVW